MYDQNFYGGGGGARGGRWEGGSSERCLKWGGGGEPLRDLSKNILKQGWAKAKVVRRGEAVLKMLPSLPPPPPKILIVHKGSIWVTMSIYQNDFPLDVIQCCLLFPMQLLTGTLLPCFSTDFEHGK